MKQLVTAFLFLLMWACQHKQDELVIESPSGNLKAIVTNEEGKLFYRLISKTGDSEVIVIKPSPLGLVRSDGNFSQNLKFETRSKIVPVSDSYTMITGKEKNLSWSANQATMLFSNEKGLKIELVFRLFDEGLAFRYVFPEISASKVTVESEATGFAVEEGADAWMSPYQSAKPWGDPGYEANYIEVKAGTASPEKVGWAFPLLFHDRGNWIFISGAGLDESYCGTHLHQDCSNGLYTVSLPEANERMGDGDVHPSSALPWEMPWRFILVAQSLHPVVESSMVHHLAEPSKTEDTSWIKPGRVSWEWWSSTGGRTVKALNHFIDLAAEMNWEYSLVDAGWENMPDGNIEDVVKYAETKDVGLFFWYNSGGRRDSSARNEDFVMFNDDSREKEMARIAGMGIKGIKVDFFATDKQMAIELYLKILHDAAKHRLLVNFHGCTLPRGWSRTYPNLLAMEAVRGAECYRFSESYPDYAPTYNTIAAFTRGIVGPTDFTPATFSNQKFPRKTTSACELALTLVYETGLLHLADTPESYRSQPLEVISFLKNVPVTWDETRFVTGTPGKEMVMARRKGDTWFVAGINGENQPKNILFQLPFLSGENYKAELIADGDTNRSFSIRSLTVGNNSDIELPLLPNGGFVMTIK